MLTRGRLPVWLSELLSCWLQHFRYISKDESSVFSLLMKRTGIWTAAAAPDLLGGQPVQGAAYTQKQFQQEKQGGVHSPATQSVGGSGSAPADLTADQVEELEQHADALTEQAGCADAAELYEQIVAWRQKMVDPDYPDTAIALNKLARLYDSQGLYEKAEPLFERTLPI